MRYLVILAFLLMVLAAVAALAVSLLVGTAIFFVAWGVWFLASIYKN